MLKTRRFVLSWLPVLVWMVIIYSASGDRSSMQHSSRLIAPFLRWLLPQLSEEGVHAGVMIGRKCAHVGEYALLALLLWRALRKPADDGRKTWSWSIAGLTVSLVAFYAASDELHQVFVPTRQGSPWDVLLDTSGALLAMACLWAIGRCRRRW